jgi:ubiquinone/menaquinone biosynthesis C-methylase UbiE
MGIEPGMVVADFGAGSGFYTMEAAKRVSNSGKVYAIDIQRELLKAIKSKAEAAGYSNVEILWADLEKPEGSKMAKETADRVIISNILFQIKDKKAVASEALRILKSEGKLILIEWNESSKLGPAPEERLTQEQARELFEGIGFIFEKDFDAGHSHYGLIFVRP